MKITVKGALGLLCFLSLSFSAEAGLGKYVGLEKQAKAPVTLAFPGTVQEVSDRNYLPRLSQMIGFSRTSIDLSLTAIALRKMPNDPVYILIEDLINAAKRDVRVRIFLNTFSADRFGESLFLREDMLEDLRKNKIEIHYVNPSISLKDNTAIFDTEWVMEGGLPWTYEDLMKGIGSATLAYSPELAQKKRTRLELLPLWDVYAKTEERRAGRLAVPLYLLKEVPYFPSMIKSEDGDAMKIYFLLLRLNAQSQKEEFSVFLEDLGAQIAAKDYVEKGSLIYQALNTLKRLEKEYALVKIEKEEADRVSLKLILPMTLGETVGVPHDFFDEHYAKDLSPEAIFAYLVILSRLQMSGESPVWLGSERNIEADFPMAPATFRVAVQELRRSNLIEIFPFELQAGKDYQAPGTLEYRYLVNPLQTMSERLATWSRLRDAWGDDDFGKAREMADLLNEPEDPKVVTVYLDLLKTYKTEDVRSLTEHVAGLTPKSTPELLDYLQTLLRNENSGTLQLATS